MQHKELILSLLKAELRITKLIQGLATVGIHADDFYTDLAESIFNLIGFTPAEQTDDLYDRYYQFLQKYETRETPQFLRTLHTAASEVLNELLAERIQCMEKG